MFWSKQKVFALSHLLLFYTDHCVNTAVVNTSQQFTFLVGSSGLALCWNGNSWWCSGGTSYSAVALGPPLCHGLFDLPLPIFLSSFSHLTVHTRKSVTSPRIAFSHLSLVVSIGDLPPEHPFNTSWGIHKSSVTVTAHTSLEELTIMNFKHHKWNTCVQDDVACMTNPNFQLKLAEFWGIFVR
jgi:hypothetical protein